MAGALRQAAVIPYRIRRNRIEVALVTTLSGKRWIVPKGAIDEGERPRDAASREAEEEAGSFLGQPEFADTPAARNGNVYAVDATSYFSRPGPRLVDGLEILACASHPDAYPTPPEGTIAKLG